MVAIPFHIDTNGYGDVSGLEVLHHTNDTNIRLQNAFYNTFKSRVNKGTFVFCIQIQLFELIYIIIQNIVLIHYIFIGLKIVDMDQNIQ